MLPLFGLLKEMVRDKSYFTCCLNLISRAAHHLWWTLFKFFFNGRKIHTLFSNTCAPDCKPLIVILKTFIFQTHLWLCRRGKWLFCILCVFFSNFSWTVVINSYCTLIRMEGFDFYLLVLWFLKLVIFGTCLTCTTNYDYCVDKLAKSN